MHHQLSSDLPNSPRSVVVPRPSVFRRDELLGARFTRYTGGVKLVSSLDAKAVRALIDEGFLEATSCANPRAPTAEVFARFLARWAPAVTAGGYARSHRTSDGGVILDALSVSVSMLPTAARDRAWWEFYELAVSADGQADRDGILSAYWE